MKTENGGARSHKEQHQHQHHQEEDQEDQQEGGGLFAVKRRKATKALLCVKLFYNNKKVYPKKEGEFSNGCKSDVVFACS